MHNSMYRDNTYHHQLSIPGTSFQNERSSRQVQQAFKKQRNRNVRRGRRLSRRGKCYQIWFDLIRVIDSYWLFFFAKLTTLMDWWKVKKKEQPIFCACVCMFRLVCSEQNGQKPIGRICLVSKWKTYPTSTQKLLGLSTIPKGFEQTLWTFKPIKVAFYKSTHFLNIQVKNENVLSKLFKKWNGIPLCVIKSDFWVVEGPIVFLGVMGPAKTSK